MKLHLPTRKSLIVRPQPNGLTILQRVKRDARIVGGDAEITKS